MQREGTCQIRTVVPGNERHRAVNTLIGTTLGGYTIKRMLGSGGMGSVYLAEDSTIGQQVAIKVIRTDDADFPDEASLRQATERFRREARAVASLDHRHILPLYRYGEENTANGQRAYMIMQYRPEGSLWDWMRQRAGTVTGASLNIAPRLPAGLGNSWPLGVEEVSNYVLQAASALQYAHDHGLIHRDIKPANFLLRVDTISAHTGATTVAIPGPGSPSGSVGYSVSLLLSDFGLAKFFSANSMSSRVFGTPTYMAPEQFEGEARPESDQYSLAVMIYYMLAARPPFEGDPMRLMRLHCTTDAPPIRQFIPKIPVGVEQTLARALAKQPQQRFPSIVAFADAFMMATAPSRQIPQPQAEQIDPNAQTAYEPRPFPPAQRPKDRENTPLPGPSGNIAAVSAPASAVNPSPPYPLPTTLTPPQSLPAAAWLPVAQQTPLQQPVQSAPQAGTMQPAPAIPSQLPQATINRRKALWAIGGTAAIALTAGTGAFFLLRQQNTGQIKASLTGHTDTITVLTWSPDGTQLASASRDMTARLWSAANHQSTVTYKGHRAALGALAWNIDGQLLASGGRDKEVRIWNTAGTTQRTFTGENVVITALCWLDSTRILAGTFGKGVQVLSLANNQPKARTAATFVRSLMLSPNHQFEAIGYQDGFLSVINMNTHKPQANYLRHNGSVNALAWSFDGTMLASAGSEGLVHIFDAVSGRLTHTLQHAAAVNGVAWNPASNSRLATACSDKQLYIWNVDSGSSTTYTGHTAAVTALSWHNKAGLASASQDKTILLWSI